MRKNKRENKFYCDNTPRMYKKKIYLKKKKQTQIRDL